MHNFLLNATQDIPWKGRKSSNSHVIVTEGDQAKTLKLVPPYTYDKNPSKQPI
ncbi:MAG: hypothetical protein M3247_06405 [Thermoproteota archaeon]|nr:hypothetical protein [Thermoproteota archaeon]